MKGVTHTAESVIAGEIGDEAAKQLIAKLEHYGYRIIRHRVVPDDKVPQS